MKAKTRTSGGCNHGNSGQFSGPRLVQTRTLLIPISKLTSQGSERGCDLSPPSHCALQPPCRPRRRQPGGAARLQVTSPALNYSPATSFDKVPCGVRGWFGARCPGWVVLVPRGPEGMSAPLWAWASSAGLGPGGHSICSLRPRGTPPSLGRGPGPRGHEGHAGSQPDPDICPLLSAPRNRDG